MRRLYLYLASRNKKGIKLITVLQSESIVTSKVTDLSSLKLPATWEKKIAALIRDNRMLYEPWVETAKDFNELRTRLKGRGFTDLTTSVTPLLNMDGYSMAPKADTSSCTVVRTMIRKAN